MLKLDVPQGCTDLLGDSKNLTSEQRLRHRAAVLYLVFFAGLCGGFVAAQQLYLWTEAARVQTAALAVRPVLPGPQAVQMAQPETCSHNVPSTPGHKGMLAVIDTGLESILCLLALPVCCPRLHAFKLTHAVPDITQALGTRVTCRLSDCCLL